MKVHVSRARLDEPTVPRLVDFLDKHGKQWERDVSAIPMQPKSLIRTLLILPMQMQLWTNTVDHQLVRGTFVFSLVLKTYMVALFPLRTVAHTPGEPNGFQLVPAFLDQLGRLTLFPGLILSTLVCYTVS